MEARYANARTDSDFEVIVVNQRALVWLRLGLKSAPFSRYFDICPLGDNRPMQAT
jgi:hypothetical protein